MLIDDRAFASTASFLAPRPLESPASPARAPAAPDGERVGLSALVGRAALLRFALKLAREDVAGPCLETPMPDEAPAARLPARGLAAAALGLIDDPAALITPNGEVDAANAAFHAGAARLRPLFAAQFFAARGGAARPRAAAGSRDEVRVCAVEGGVLILFALREEGDADGGALAVLRAPQESGRCCDPALLEQAFALTPAEARLACALMRTKSLPAAIRELGLKDKTGRTYLDRIFQKTGARSQLQLYAILMELYLLSTPGA